MRVCETAQHVLEHQGTVKLKADAERELLRSVLQATPADRDVVFQKEGARLFGTVVDCPFFVPDEAFYVKWNDARGRTPGGCAPLSPTIRTATTGAALPRLTGTLEKSEIRDSIQAAILEFRRCYERVLSSSNGDVGRIETRFLIGPTGRVVEADVVDDDLDNQSVSLCVLNVICNIEFPAPRGDGAVLVSYPFEFRTH